MDGEDFEETNIAKRNNKKKNNKSTESACEIDMQMRWLHGNAIQTKALKVNETNDETCVCVCVYYIRFVRVEISWVWKKRVDETAEETYAAWRFGKKNPIQLFVYMSVCSGSPVQDFISRRFSQRLIRRGVLKIYTKFSV